MFACAKFACAKFARCPSLRAIAKGSKANLPVIAECVGVEHLAPAPFQAPG
jgi:hypothetical protein